MARFPWQALWQAYVWGLGVPLLLGGMLQWLLPGDFPFVLIGALVSIPLVVFLGVRALWPAFQIGEEPAVRKSPISDEFDLSGQSRS